MRSLYEEEKDITFLQASLDAYRCAFKLADYVEKTYNSDEARLFLNKIKYTVHSNPIDISLQLYDLTQKNEYLEAAYTFDQQNKASILALNVHENELRKKSSAGKILLEEEASVKTSITRLLLKLSRTVDSQQAEAIHSSIRDHEIRLGKLQEQIKADPNYRSGYFITQIPPVTELQKKLDEKTAIVSYHLSGDELLAIFITGNRLDYYKTAVNREFFNNTDSLKTSLQSTAADKRYSGSSSARKMYKYLITPLEERLHHISRLIIIPDDELYYLPFEALQDEKGKYLIEKLSVQYQYSTSLWGDDNIKK
jgi:CHAT domain-containing protein